MQLLKTILIRRRYIEFMTLLLTSFSLPKIKALIAQGELGQWVEINGRTVRCIHEILQETYPKCEIPVFFVKWWEPSPTWGVTLWLPSVHLRLLCHFLSSPHSDATENSPWWMGSDGFYFVFQPIKNKRNRKND